MLNPEQVDGYASRSEDQSAATLLRDVNEFLNYIAIVKTPEWMPFARASSVPLRMAKRELLKAVASVPV